MGIIPTTLGASPGFYSGAQDRLVDVASTMRLAQTRPALGEEPSAGAQLLASVLRARENQVKAVDDFICGGEILIRKEDQQATLDKIDEAIGYLSKRLASS